MKKNPILSCVSDEEMKKITENILNQDPPMKFIPKPKVVQEAKCNVRILSVPDRAVSVSIDDEDRVKDWNIVSLKEYKIIARSWRGPSLDGNQSIPLLTEQDEDHMSDRSDDDMYVSILKDTGAEQLSDADDEDADLSSISSDEDVLYPEPSKEIVKVQYGSLVKNSSKFVKKDATDLKL